MLFASTSQAIAIWPYPQIGKWEESLHQVDNYIDKWRAAPSVLLIMNYLGSKSLSNSSNHLTSMYSGHYVCGDAASDTIRTRALIDQGEHQLKSTKYLNFRLGIHTTVQS